jgi:hypothetical protein
VVSLQRGGAFGQAALQANQIAHPDALLALCVTAAMFGRSAVAYLVWAAVASRRSGRVCRLTEDPRGTLPE